MKILNYIYIVYRNSDPTKKWEKDYIEMITIEEEKAIKHLEKLKKYFSGKSYLVKYYVTGGEKIDYE